MHCCCFHMIRCPLKPCRMNCHIVCSLKKHEMKNDVVEKKGMSLNSKYIDFHKPTCPKCDHEFDIEPFHKYTPIMSMSCCHTICYNCVQLSVEINRKKLRRPLIKSTNCPIENCLSQHAYRYESENWNMSLMNYVQNINDLLKKN